ncbi:oligosaccharide flippase family protein [Sphingomonas sanguinis]|jgi:O-antigen/teichoic acid export membrane protein|uniref:oligosaccharide flippase family protein n=1 Tax=Sphingomonas sp. LC-1 TaxID=3110957 RepID=UPI0021BA7CD3|nr:oligosaccharide flippase family protein [Sphingomonas sp. LC-1]MCT8003875.1 oligosaccharide flippase family protein [Sphingomonas sp. LC-1]
MGRNALANLAARVWMAAMNFLFVPLYIQFLGIEAYGLIGFFAAMMAAFALLDLGLSLTINRELARRADTVDTRSESRDLLRTLEVVYWGVAVVIGAGIALAAPIIVHRWLNIGTLPAGIAVNAVRVMGFTALLRWPVPLYVGAMLGLQRQVLLSFVTSAGSTLASGGAALILLLGVRDIAAFFLWQAVAAAVMVIALRTIVWRSLSMPRHVPAVRWESVKKTIGFSAGVTGITLLSILVGQLDKFVLARALPLGIFGFYTLASAIAATVSTAGSAIEAAAFPAMSRIVAEGRTDTLAKLYHSATQGLALIVLPAAITVILFAPELLSFYVGNSVVVAGAAPLLRVLMAGHAILALMFLPLSLQLAHGWTRLSIYKNSLSLVVFVPTLILLVRHLGALGGAISWLLLTLSYLLIEIPIMHRRLLPGEQWRWYGVDVLMPAFAATAILGAIRMILPTGMGSLATIFAIGTGWALAMVVCGLLLPASRGVILSRLRRGDGLATAGPASG